MASSDGVEVRMASAEDDSEAMAAIINEAYEIGESGIIESPFSRVLVDEVESLASQRVTGGGSGGSGGEGGTGGTKGYSGGSSCESYIINDFGTGEFVDCFAQSGDLGAGGQGGARFGRLRHAGRAGGVQARTGRIPPEAEGPAGQLHRPADAGPFHRPDHDETGPRAAPR